MLMSVRLTVTNGFFDFSIRSLIDVLLSDNNTASNNEVIKLAFETWI